MLFFFSAKPAFPYGMRGYQVSRTGPRFGARVQKTYCLAHLLRPWVSCPTLGQKPKPPINNLNTSLTSNYPRIPKNNQKWLKTIPKWSKTIPKTLKMGFPPAAAPRPPCGRPIFNILGVVIQHGYRVGQDTHGAKKMFNNLSSD